MWTTFIITSIFPIECPLSRRCWANADFLLLYLKSLACSWNLVLKGLPVCPVYIILQSGQVNWYTPLLTYLYLVLCSFERRCPIVICCERACYVRVPKYFGDVTGFFPDIREPFFFCICVLRFCFSFCLCPGMSRFESYLLLARICFMVSFSFSLHSGDSL